MKFKRLEVAGFKSFADKLEIKFGAGITAIVGPNGCGKSNVADSIRWVLGEQSAKLLRGSSMQDVIFKGTQSRKSLSFCEVDLVFDNSDKQLFPSLDFNEVVISRKLYGSGDSEYLLNKTVVRLKDIVDLLHDANMGKEGYSIIGQGRIDELLSSKPEDRRAIFEEAAGISKFKKKKKDAERKLERTEESLRNVNAVLDEKAKQLEPLTRQSENARKWLELRDRLKHFEINSYIYQYDTASDAKEVIISRYNGLTEEIDLRQKECDFVTLDYNEAMSELNRAGDSITRLSDELLKISVNKEKLTGDLKLLNERMGYLTRENESLKDEVLRLDNDYKTLTMLIEDGSKSLEDMSSQYDSKKRELDELNSRYIGIVNTISVTEGETEERHRILVDAMTRLSDIKSNLSRLVAEREALAERIVNSKARLEFNNTKYKNDLQQEEELKAEIEALDTQKTSKASLKEQRIAEHNSLLHEVNVLATKLDKLNERFYTLKTQHKLLVDMQEAYDSFAFSVKKLLSDAKDNKALSSRIEGIVAKLLSVDQRFETAIESALGNAVQNIVTANEDDAKFLIEYLKQKRYGRVTFLPVTAAKPRRLDAQYSQYMNATGCYGEADKLCKFDSRYEGIVRSLLGGTVIVENIDVAVELAKKTNYGFKIVTLEGDIINPRGSITGGSKKSEIANIFGYDREINALKIEIDQVSAQIQEITDLRAKTAQNAEATQKEARSLREEAHNLEVLFATRNESYKKLRGLNEELAVEIGNLEFELLHDSERVEVIDKDLNSVAELENIVTSQKDDAGKVDEEQLRQHDALKQERNDLQAKTLSVSLEVSSLENNVQNTENELKRLRENVLLTGEKIEYNNSRLAENSKIFDRLIDEKSKLLVTEDDSSSDRANEIRMSLSNLDELKHKNQQLISSLDKKRMELIGEIQSLHEKRGKEELMLQKVDTDIEMMRERVFEEYKLEYSDCLPFKEDNYDHVEGAQQSQKLKRQMSLLGNINLDAIEQCKEMYKSYNEMTIQKEDFLKAKSDLEKIIAEFNVEMLTRFSESFEQIRTNFQKIFRELFDGGTADLCLMENENQLEAGIEIIAQPPEKRLGSISLLSGGERALTAIAILFAILRLKPMPFCVLDEIEAALDDANAGRFARYLRRFSEGTQFIVITHRKPTMELADNLYGVTMEEKGVSKIVSIKLSEAVAVAENGTVTV